MVALVRLSAMLAVGGAAHWRAALQDATEVAGQGATEEAVLQSYLFVGFPVVLNVLAIQRESAAAPAPVPDGDLLQRKESGERLCGLIYGPAYERLRAHVATLHPDLDRWMIEEGYGKTLSRPGLSAIERELCVVALLAAAGHLPQLRSHLRGALNVGATKSEISAAVNVGVQAAAECPVRVTDPHGARSAWDDVQTRAGVV
jgi:4-carboxymuconolactone decarboxylase